MSVHCFFFFRKSTSASVWRHQIPANRGVNTDNMAVQYTPHLFKEMDPTCKYKMYLLDESGLQCKKPCCQIGFFECQWIDNCIPCPLRWQYGGGGPIDPTIKIRIVNDAKLVVTTLATSHSIAIPEVVDIYDLLDATRIVQKSIEGTETTMQTLTSIAAVLEKIESERD